MKKIKCYITVLCLLTTGIASAAPTSFKEQTESWLQRSNETTTTESSGSLRDDPPGEPDWDAPIGDALLLLTGLGFVYASCLHPVQRQKKIYTCNK
jgi:hypothetical protein